MAQIIALLVAKDPTTEMVAVWIVIHPGEISNPARWKTMHEDVINHCVPAGSKKKEEKGLDLHFYCSVFKKGRGRHKTWGCNSFKRGCEVFESSYTSISHHFCLDILWRLCVVKDFCFFRIQVFIIISRIPTQTCFFCRGSVPISLMEHVSPNDLTPILH